MRRVRAALAALAVALVAALLVAAAAVATTGITRRAIARAREVFPLPWCETINVYTDVARPGDVAWTFPAEQPCTVYFDESTFRSVRDDDPTYYCALLAHEFGHLSGLGHSDDPHNVMYPIVGGYIPKPCRDMSPGTDSAPSRSRRHG